ncbi:MAG: Rrf2 family transcriptional regulator [Saprospiraceae bacterium]|jgi:Rrf2 family protein
MFSKACKYGIRAAIFIAVKTREGQKSGVVEISDTLNVPKAFLAKILQKLVKADLISSTKGPYGGFYLSEENMKKTVDHIITCIDGDDLFKGCVLGLPVCSESNPCPLHEKVYPFREGIYYQMRHQTIADLAYDYDASQNRL